MFKKYLKLIVTIILLIIIGISGCILYKELSAYKQESDVLNYVDNLIEQSIDDDSEEFNYNSWITLKESNSDFVGYLKFDSGIIKQPIVKGPDNDYYLWRNFDKSWNGTSGTPFMNAYSNIDNMNITIYGHNNAWNHDNLFSRLNDMATNQEYYEENSTFKFYVEDSIREYAICYIYYITEEEYQNYDFQLTNISDNIFDEFISFPRRKNLIKSIHGDIKSGNKWVTLQTCKRYNDDVKVIVLAKEVLRYDYD